MRISDPKIAWSRFCSQLGGYLRRLDKARSPKTTTGFRILGETLNSAESITPPIRAGTVHAGTVATHIYLLTGQLKAETSFHFGNQSVDDDGQPDKRILLTADGQFRLTKSLLRREARMLRRDKVPDAKITQQVTQRLSSGGIRPPSRVVVATASGEVTLSGSIQYEHQRQAAMQATRGVDGIRRVVDRLSVIPAPRRE